MIPPTLPEDESSRLANLYASDLLDTPPEERFDRYTRIAQKLYQVPIALISFVDINRQWFRSYISLPVNETSREISFCGYAILNDDLFVINDTAKDQRFKDNPLVTKIHLFVFMQACRSNWRIKRKSELASIELAVNDELTGLLNRRGFLLLANNNLLLSLRSELPVTLHFFDLDGFKAVNDNYGHDLGDRL
jgi:predicted signal transduction protein with EAL and GGDEF domain